MQMAQTVIVLMPNGRRQVIKATPNTALLQILEEACEKHAFQPELYDLKHHRKILDISLSVRFAGLPNNCLLELIKRDSVRKDNIVTISLQSEDGDRKMDDFNSSCTIYDVVYKLNPTELSETTIIIYMRNEIYGSDLKIKTLKSLGITSGRAILRLIHRCPEELKTQANVSVPLAHKPFEEKYCTQQIKDNESYALKSNFIDVGHSSNDSHILEDSNSEKCYDKYSEANKILHQIPQEKKKQTAGLKVKNMSKQQASMNFDAPVEEIIYLGDHNAMLFSYETAQVLNNEELPDDFYDLSVDDIKRLLKDIKHKQKQMDETPLLTAAMRELEESKKQLRIMNQYKKAIIRVQFPNQMVLQGIFKPSDTIKDIKNFVKEYLADSGLNFYLFTAPPKVILNENLNLLEANCVPAALLHFGCEKQLDNYLKPEILFKISTTSCAAIAASKARLENIRTTSEDYQEKILDSESLMDTTIYGPCTSDTISPTDYQTVPKSVPEKLPKWFKPSK